MQALHDVVQAGWVRYIGMSSCYAYQCEYRAHLSDRLLDSPMPISRSPSDAE